jgi:hypothetical protein
MYMFVMSEEGQPTTADSCPCHVCILHDVKVNFVLIVLLCKVWFYVWIITTNLNLFQDEEDVNNHEEPHENGGQDSCDYNSQ